jgi:hypothetical protein
LVIQGVMKGQHHQQGWNWKRTEGAIVSAIVGGVVGPALHSGMAGIVGHKITGSAIGIIVHGAAHEITTEQLSDFVLTGRTHQTDYPWASATAGASEGVIDAAKAALQRRRSRNQAMADIGPIHIPILDTDLPGSGDARFQGEGSFDGDFKLIGRFSDSSSFEGLVELHGKFTPPNGQTAVGLFRGQGLVSGKFDGIFERGTLNLQRDTNMLEGAVTGRGILRGQFDLTGTVAPRAGANLFSDATVPAVATAAPSTPYGPAHGRLRPAPAPPHRPPPPLQRLQCPI